MARLSYSSQSFAVGFRGVHGGVRGSLNLDVVLASVVVEVMLMLTVTLARWANDNNDEDKKESWTRFLSEAIILIRLIGMDHNIYMQIPTCWTQGVRQPFK
jgi:uncharacterized membrane protein